MTDQRAITESRYLLLSAFGNLVIGLFGLFFAYIAKSQAIQLDAVFNLTYFLTGILALWVLQLLQEGDNPQFPFGYMYLEPLTNGAKGLLVLGISLYSGFDAAEAIFAGGRPIQAGIAVVYGMIASAVCWILAWASKKGYKKTDSPLLQVDQENWIINAIISSCVLLGFIAVWALENTAWSWMIPYCDPVLVLVVVVLCIYVPVRMCWDAMMALLNRSPDGLFEELEPLVIESLSSLPLDKVFVRAIQPGRTRYVLVHAVVKEDIPLSLLDKARETAYNKLQSTYKDVTIDIVCSQNPKWAMTLSAARQAGLVSGR